MWNFPDSKFFVLPGRGNNVVFNIIRACFNTIPSRNVAKEQN